MLNFGIRFSKLSTSIKLPASDELIAHLPGSKRDIFNGFNFTISDCPNNTWLDNLAAAISDNLGSALWFQKVTPQPTWGCTYNAPASGEDGYTELLAADDGTLYTTGVSTDLLLADLQALNTDWIFWSAARGLGIYNQLSGQNLLDVQAYFS